MPVPDKPTLPALRAAAANCKACDLWKLGTQTVFGERRANRDEEMRKFVDDLKKVAAQLQQPRAA